MSSWDAGLWRRRTLRLLQMRSHIGLRNCTDMLEDSSAFNVRVDDWVSGSMIELSFDLFTLMMEAASSYETLVYYAKLRGLTSRKTAIFINPSWTWYLVTHIDHYCACPGFDRKWRTRKLNELSAQHVHYAQLTSVSNAGGFFEALEKEIVPLLYVDPVVWVGWRSPWFHCTCKWYWALNFKSLNIQQTSKWCPLTPERKLTLRLLAECPSLPLN